MPSSAVITGAAPAWVSDRLAGPGHRGVVLHIGRDAFYVRSRGDAIGITSRRATTIPCTIATRAPDLPGILGTPRLRVGDPVSIGGGRLELGDALVRVGRIVDFTLYRLDPDLAPSMRACLGDAIGEIPQGGELDAATLRLLCRDPRDALPAVLGKGSGLTPFGDDVVCGALATMLALGDPCAPGLRSDAVALAPGLTTTLSTTLIRRAAEGETLPAFAAVVNALAHHRHLARANIDTLRAVGHTSGAGMLLGLHLALDHITTRRCS